MNLRFRILILVISLLLVVMSGISIPLYWYTRSAMEDQLDRYLSSTLDLVANSLDRGLVAALITEPGLNGVRERLEKELSSSIVDEIEGIAVLNTAGSMVVYSGKLPYEQLPVYLPEFRAGSKEISEILRNQDGKYLKSALSGQRMDNGTSFQVVIWGGVGFMAVVEQMLGSLFWIIVLALLAGIGMAIIFSRSLVRPVQRLSAYTAEIRRNIYSDQVDLRRGDEIGALNQALNDMHGEILVNERSNKELLSAIAHEIKNPLGGIEIYTGLLESELESAEHKDYLGKINKELQNLKKIVLEYLDYARPPKSRIEPQKIDTIITDAVRLLDPEIDIKKVSVSVTGSATLPGDESKLRRVMVNLLKNSLDAVVENGQINVDVVDGGGRVEIHVSDNGDGIPAENIERIFQPHFSTRDQGYGLGLAIVKSIIDEMNGTVVVNSTAGQGTEFIITLPGN